MTTATTKLTQLRFGLGSVIMCAGLAVVLVVGVVGAVVWQPPRLDLSVLPIMAEQPVLMPDGARFLAQKYEVSVAEWNRCHDAGACALSLRVRAGKDAAITPATGLSFVDVGQYVGWINQTTGRAFRLPTLAEWERMAIEVMPKHPDPIFTAPELTWASSYLTAPQTKRTLREQGAFQTTSQGIADLDGSVWEWTSDCYAGVSGGTVPAERCAAFFVGGEHIATMPFLERDPARGGCAVGAPPAHLGMRLVSDTLR